MQTSKTEQRHLSKKQSALLLASILIVALCGIVYELIIGSISSYLLGDSVYQFSLTIGFFMFAMGIGSYASRFINGNLIQAFIYVELVLAFIGGLCSISLFMLFPAAPWLYTTGMFTFIMSIGFLVGLEIPLLTRALSQQASMKESLSNVLSLDYIGALFGSVIFPILLLPSLGLIASSFAIGLINSMVALFNILWLRQHLDRPKMLLAAVGAVIAALFVLTLIASRITAFAQDHLYFDQIIWKKQSQYQSLVVTNNWQKGDVRLFIDGHLQFSETDEYRYHEALVHPVLSWSEAPRNVLVLGGGDGMAIREVLKHSKVEKIDLVDLDPAMTELGNHFEPIKQLNQNSLASEKVTIINQDAFLFVKQTDKIYDRIIIDFPDPHNEALAKLYSIEFYAMLYKIMSDNGALVTQSSSPFFATKTYWSIGHTLEEIFQNRLSYQISIPSFGIWGFHMAMKNNKTDFAPYPDNLRLINEKTFAAAQIFPNDISEPEKRFVNSIFDPKIYQLYAEDTKSF